MQERWSGLGLRRSVWSLLLQNGRGWFGQGDDEVDAKVAGPPGSKGADRLYRVMGEKLSVGFAQPREEKVKGGPYCSLMGWGERMEPGSSQRWGDREAPAGARAILPPWQEKPFTRSRSGTNRGPEWPRGLWPWRCSTLLQPHP